MTKETGRNIEIDLPEVVLHEFQHMLLARGKTAEKRNTSTLKPLNRRDRHIRQRNQRCQSWGRWEQSHAHPLK